MQVCLRDGHDGGISMETVRTGGIADIHPVSYALDGLKDLTPA